MTPTAPQDISAACEEDLREPATPSGASIPLLTISCSLIRRLTGRWRRSTVALPTCHGGYSHI